MTAPALRLTRLTLSDFRSYEQFVWRPAGRVMVVAGPNGSGKTNLLEAISLLTPGRGLRGARVAELPRRGAGAWAVAGRFETPVGAVDIGTGSPPDGPVERRVFRLDGAAPRSQADIAQRVAAVWLTPQMDRLFQEGVSGRRRFLDRLVYAVEPGHAREVSAYETAMASRNRLLAERRGEAVWLDGIEEAMARHAVAATVARALGIGMVYQHFTVVPGMTVAENLLIARGKLPAVIDWRAVRAELQAFMATAPFQLDLDATPQQLSAGEKQKLEILKQLFLQPRLLILDEPTSVLTPQEADEVLGALRARAHAGDCSVVMITHKFREVMAFADDVTVLRRGKLVKLWGWGRWLYLLIF